MGTRYFALIMGIAFLLIGVMGFIPAFVTQHADQHHLAVEQNHGYLLGVWPVNAVHNVVHIVSGLLGILAYSALGYSRLYAQTLAIVYGVVTIMGLIPQTWAQTTFGLMPIHGHDVWLHGVIAIAAAYFGWAPVVERRTDLGDVTAPRV
jgi:hypothetical protein